MRGSDSELSRSVDHAHIRVDQGKFVQNSSSAIGGVVVQKENVEIESELKQFGADRTDIVFLVVCRNEYQQL